MKNEEKGERILNFLFFLKSQIPEATLDQTREEFGTN